MPPPGIEKEVWDRWIKNGLVIPVRDLQLLCSLTHDEPNMCAFCKEPEEAIQ